VAVDLDYFRGLLQRVVSDPVRVGRRLGTRAGWRRIWYIIHPPPHGDWKAEPRSGLQVRDYERYQDYVVHQRSKLEQFDWSRYDVQFRAALAERLQGSNRIAGAESVLCLASRLGTEVRAFRDVGAFAVGIDLQPGKNSTSVLHGDFHALDFPDSSVDLIYCNSLDHALDLRTVLAEVRRVLKPTGRLMVDAQKGTLEVEEFDDWAATSWPSIDELARFIASTGFNESERAPIQMPWVGHELIFEVQ